MYYSDSSCYCCCWCRNVFNDNNRLHCVLNYLNGTVQQRESRFLNSWLAIAKEYCAQHSSALTHSLYCRLLSIASGPLLAMRLVTEYFHFKGRRPPDSIVTWTAFVSSDTIQVLATVVNTLSSPSRADGELQLVLELRHANRFSPDRLICCPFFECLVL